MEDKPIEQKPPYCVERRTFDPEILNATLQMMQKSINDHAASTTVKFKELKDEIGNIRKNCEDKNCLLIKLDKELAVHQASQTTKEGSTEHLSNKRNSLLFQILTIVTAVGALIIATMSYFKVIGG